MNLPSSILKSHLSCKGTVEPENGTSDRSDMLSDLLQLCKLLSETVSTDLLPGRNASMRSPQLTMAIGELINLADPKSLRN